jgi:hypothetical protein
LKDLVERVEECKGKLQVVSFQRGFPYKLGGEYWLSVGRPDQQPVPVQAPPKASGKMVCRVAGCGKEIAADRIRQHVGGHILLGEGSKVMCGLCGSPAAQGRCVVELGTGTKAGITTVTVKNCPVPDGFKYAAAAKGSDRSPCTNVPAKCPVCGDVVWSYHMLHHIEECHPAEAITSKLLEQYAISSGEFEKVIAAFDKKKRSGKAPTAAQVRKTKLTAQYAGSTPPAMWRLLLPSAPPLPPGSS